jgi:glycerol uptake facilitator-like aquaporin
MKLPLLLTNKYFIEFVEVLILILVILTTGNYFLISLVLVISVFLGGPLTTGNPAVVFTLYRANKINSYDLLFYLIAEILGVVIGFEIYNRIFRKD